MLYVACCGISLIQLRISQIRVPSIVVATSLLSLMLLFTNSGNAQNSLGRADREDVARAVVSLRLVTDTGSFTASGFVVSPSGFIFTINDFVNRPEVEAIYVSTFSGFNSPPVETYQASIVFTSDELDLAVLQIDSDARGEPLFSDELRLDYIFNWGLEWETTIGEAVFTFAYQETGELSVDSGSVVARRSTSEPETVSETEDFIDITFFGPGNRGGAVVNLDGEVVGIVTDIEPNPIGGTANLTRFIPLYVLCGIHEAICNNLFVSTPPSTRSSIQAVICLPQGTPLDLREEPSVNSRSLERVRLGDHVSVLENPSVTADGVSWVQLQTRNGNRGWLPDIFNQSRTILTYESEILGEQRHSIEVGGQAMVCATFPHEDMPQWSRPNGSIDRRLRSGAIVDIISGPVERPNGEWWQVIDIQGNSGWMVDSEDGTRSLIGLP